MMANDIYQPEERGIVLGSSSIGGNSGNVRGMVPVSLHALSGEVILMTAHGFHRDMHMRVLLPMRYAVCDEEGWISLSDNPPYNAYQIFELNDALSAAENRPVYLEVTRRPQPAEKPKRILDL